jgi:GNAT superfamily N-acetyltransferase
MQRFLEECCTISLLNGETLAQCQPFNCGDADLDNFFLCDAVKYERQLLGRSYCFCLKENPAVIVCAFTLSNSSVEGRNLPASRKKKLTKNIPHEKSLSSYPAVLIGRLGVNSKYKKIGIGTELIEFIKGVAVLPKNWPACRYLTVDAYNNEEARKYYEANGFQFLFSTEEQEREHIGLPDEKELKTRLMFFDLIRLYVV